MRLLSRSSAEAVTMRASSISTTVARGMSREHASTAAMLMQKSSVEVAEVRSVEHLANIPENICTRLGIGHGAKPIAGRVSLSGLKEA
jgi:hypothetical protein